MNFERLTEKFMSKEICWRLGTKIGQKFMALPYVDARAIQNRLDEVVGPFRWKDSYEVHTNGIICTLSIWCDQALVNGSAWVDKANGSPETNIEAFKGGISKAFIRAAVNWGIGRYLYDLKDLYAQEVDSNYPGARYHWVKKEGREIFWVPPSLPLSAISDREKLMKELGSKLRSLTDGCKNKELYAHYLAKLELSSGSDILNKDDEWLEEALLYLGELSDENNKQEA